MFSEITLIDFRKPLANRKRTVTGPYRWRPTPAGSGRGFYMQDANGGALECAPHGSGFRLRIYPANDFLSGYTRLARINGYFIDEFENETLQPIIAKLPHGRGYLAGWTMGEGMLSSLEPDLHDSAEEAAMAAHDGAERAAEREREYQETLCPDCGLECGECECEAEAS